MFQLSYLDIDNSSGICTNKEYEKLSISYALEWYNLIQNTQQIVPTPCLITIIRKSYLGKKNRSVS